MRRPSSKNAFRVGDDLDHILGRLLGENRLLQFKRELEYDHAKGCLSCLVHELALPRDDSEEGGYELRSGSLEDYVRIDSSAAEAINLLPPPITDNRTVEYGSIYQILNR